MARAMDKRSASTKALIENRRSVKVAQQKVGENSSESPTDTLYI